jgi:hypothetical protein
VIFSVFLPKKCEFIRLLIFLLLLRRFVIIQLLRKLLVNPLQHRRLLILHLNLLTFAMAFNIQLVEVGSNIAELSTYIQIHQFAVSGNPNLITGNVPPAGSTDTHSFGVVLDNEAG